MRKIILSGRLAADAETKMTKNGTPFIEFRMANNEFVGGTENNGYETYWFRVTTFTQNLFKLTAHLKKGSPVEVIGRLSARPYISGQGKPEAGLEVLADDILFDSNFSNKQNNDGTATAPQAQPTAPATAPQPPKKTTPRNPTTTPITVKTAAAQPVPQTTEEDTDDLPF